jgi:hypothetical protein
MGNGRERNDFAGYALSGAELFGMLAGRLLEVLAIARQRSSRFHKPLEIARKAIYCRNHGVHRAGHFFIHARDAMRLRQKGQRFPLPELTECLAAQHGGAAGHIRPAQFSDIAAYPRDRVSAVRSGQRPLQYSPCRHRPTSAFSGRGIAGEWRPFRCLPVPLLQAGHRALREHQAV